MICLERALRREDPDDPEVDEVIERILAERADES